ncbi:HAMP domain-containing sensor histidine kinase [Mucilaginibacter sp. PAMB04168]|uniref:sensor histidine kinase n=1 Tax=Mucilaginibacter sp. PAMB04168 TaxID=3138567 RepID=UPI0031F626C7
MDTSISASELRLRSIMQHAPLGLAEIDASGKIVNLNLAGTALLKPLTAALSVSIENIFPILDVINPKVVPAIKAFSQPGGLIMGNEQCHFSYPGELDLVEKDFSITVSKMADCFIVSFEDVTEKVSEEKAMVQAELDKAVAQGKFEIASEVLHDIGNAVVGFGSYLTRINRMMEQNNLANLKNVAGFMKAQQQAFGQVIGTDKAGALVNLMEGIAKSQEEHQTEIKRSIADQLNIIAHIQDILNIQRQYVVGHEAQERKPVNLRSIINDCRAMVFGAIDKKGIKLTLDMPAEGVVIKGDRTKLMQVILNILKNSIEAIDLNAEDKRIYLGLTTQEGSVNLVISDSGKGFDEATGAHLFERGYTTKSTGTGLGLYNCRSIIESHSGTITITSDGPGKGATTAILFKS